MKFNWGTGITIFIILFVSAIGLLIYKVSGEKIELVTENYYEKELQYQSEIDALKNAALLDTNVFISQKDDNINITFPSTLISDSIKGYIYFYRPSNKKMDKNIKLSVNELNTMNVPAASFNAGLYKVTINWSHYNVPYQFKKDILID